ncbi:hypothetical protein JXA88_11020 [Candidatus Fermentibacteria bacterium]|nr:hypothetical protein [Candidatus Fermentibacteria bacterium]
MAMGTDNGCLGEVALAMLAHGLADEASDDAAAHLSACRHCAARLEEMRRAVDLVPVPPLEDPGDDFNRAIWKRIGRRKVRRRRALALASMLSAAAAVLVFTLPGGRGRVDEADLVEKLDLYQHFELIEYLDVVETLDALLGVGTSEG